MSKVCADESLVASSHTCDERFSSGFFEMRDNPFADYLSSRLFFELKEEGEQRRRK